MRPVRRCDSVQTISVHPLVWSKYVAGVVASSGWEHVNVFERLANNVIVGFHSWIYLFNEEQDGDFNYLGYIIQTVEHWIDQCHFNSRRFVRQHQVVHSIECWRQSGIGFGNRNFVLRRTSRRSLHPPGFKRSPVHLGNAYRHLQWNPARRELPSHLLISASYGGKFE